MKIGTIGTSMISGVFADAVSRNEGVECTAACSRSEQSGRMFAEKHGIDRIYLSLDEMLTDPELEFIYIGSPNSMHYEHTMKALAAGRHVICEKPFSSNSREAERMVSYAKERGVFLFEAITVMHSPQYQQLQNHIGEIGPIRMIQCKYVKYSGRCDQLKQGQIPNIFNPAFSGGALMDLNVYNIHFVTGLIGYPKRVSYIASRYDNGIDLEGIAVLHYPDILCTCTAGKDINGKNDIQIHGERGYIYIPGGTSGKKGFTLVTDQGEKVYYTEEDVNPLYHEVQAFRAIYEGKDLEKCYQLLDHTKCVMEVLDKARADAQIHFEADDRDIL